MRTCTSSICITALLSLAAVSCGDDEDTKGNQSGPTASGNDQTPPMGATAVAAWIAQGHYRSWRCESAPHAARPHSPHGLNRICSNGLLSSHGAGEYPVGAAAVKELFIGSGTTPAGYAVYLHTKAGTGGDSWYWFEDLPGSGVVADGLGASVCVGCHVAAGSDATHSGHDFVYTQVK